MTLRGRLRIGLGLLILAASISFLTWGLWPVRREIRVRPITDSTQSALLEKRVITLAFPPKIRAGDSAVVRLTLGVDAASSLTPIVDVGSPNLYDTHNIIAEARFDLPGMDIQPSELISAPIAQGQTAVFYWTLRPQAVGHFRGTIWLYFRNVNKLTGQEIQETVSAQIVEIDSVEILGLSANRARAAGLVGTVIGLALSIPFFTSMVRMLVENRARNM